MRKCLLFLLFCVSCSADDDKPNSLEFYTPKEYKCNIEECGGYPELLKCDGGIIINNMKCIFVDRVGCSWVCN